jgi:hypothetical protein
MSNELSLYKTWKKLINKLIKRKEKPTSGEKTEIEKKTLYFLCRNENKKYINVLKNLSLESKVRKAAKKDL